MKHDAEAFIKDRFAQYEINDVAQDWLASLEAREDISAHTVENYRGAVNSLLKSMALHGTPATLEYLTESVVHAWRIDMAKGAVIRFGKPASPASVVGRIINLKVFTHKWLRGRYTHHDLLELVEVGKAELPPKPAFSQKQRQAIMDAVEGNSFVNVRDRAFIQLLQATACRFKEIGGLTLGRVDMEKGMIQVQLKGGRYVDVALQKAALRDLKAYIGRRRLVTEPGFQALWVTEQGTKMSRNGMRAIFDDRLSSRVGFRANPHRFRHTVTKYAASSGAPVADIQAMLHHSSPTMTQRYIGEARRAEEAKIPLQWGLSAS